MRQFSVKLVVFLKLLLVVSSQTLNQIDSKDYEQRILWERLENELEHLNSKNGMALTNTLNLNTALSAVPFRQQIDLSSNDFHNFSDLLHVAQEKMASLTNGHTLQESVQLANKNVDFPNKKDLPQIIKGINPGMPTDDAKNLKLTRDTVTNALYRLLNFYDVQLDEIHKCDTVIALLFLKDIDDKHGKVLQQKFPLGELATRNCEATGKRIDLEGQFCHSLVRQWTNSSAKRTSFRDQWKSPDVLKNILEQSDTNTLENIGNEKEGMWGPLNGQCQIAIVNRCEVPYVCERTFLDPTPRSQYLLTHQLFQRLLIDNMDCPNFKSLKSDTDVYTNLCAKMYMEAQYLDALNVPVLQRDLFAEYVGFCGYMGYSNFIRQDWLERILSWQSKSDYGCFVKSPLSPIGILSTDVGFKRQATQKEINKGIQESGEKCLPHFTTVGLIALSVHYDYLMDASSSK